MALSMLPPSARPRAHGLDVLGEAEGAGAGDVALVRPVPMSNSTRWPVESTAGWSKVDLEAQLVAVVRLQPRPLGCGAFALAHLHAA
jgi:hypothetical protein